MGRIKQGIFGKRKATRKDNKSKYTYRISKTISQTVKNGTETRKYSYTKKIKLANGKYRYYYT